MGRDTWWNSVYNKAVRNITIDDDQKLKVKEKKTSKKRKNDNYSGFIQSGVLDNGVVRETGRADDDLGTFVVSDDEALFAACEGRTAHKAARHGNKLSGKLARIEEQERLLLEETSKKHKKKKK